MHHTFTLALLGGLVYFLVWWLHRRHQQKVHAHYREQHAQERIRRTNYVIGNPHQPMHPDEQLRRAEWEGEHGHLMSAMDIKNREEGRWPLGNAFQGLAGLVTGLVIATLVWDGKSISPPPEQHETTVSSAPTNVTVVADHATLFDQEFLLLLVLLGAGGMFWKLSKGKAGPLVGGGLVLTASLLSGLKLLSIEKIIAIDKLVGIDIGDCKPAPPASVPASTYSQTITLPAFISGSATPSPRMLCALQRVAADMARMPGLFSVVVTASADRQELNPGTSKLYGNNWALAQQRGNAVATLLAPQLPASANLLVTNAGPAHTTGARDAALMAQDRTPSLRFTGLGTLPPELQTPRPWQSVCPP
jgi:hypothetical protein